MAPETNPTVIEMLQDHLAAHGYDGLFNAHGGCACKADELAPCLEYPGECCAGYEKPAAPETGYDYHIVAEKPKETT